MPVAIAASLIGLVVVLVAYYRDPPLVARRLEPPPEWGPLPDPGEVSRTEFPLAFPGYDPATVEIHFELLLRAYSDVLEAATPEVLQRARQRAALRAGAGAGTAGGVQPRPRAYVPPADQPQTQPAASSLAAPLSSEGSDAEALRAEAALADLEAQQTPGGSP